MHCLVRQGAGDVMVVALEDTLGLGKAVADPQNVGDLEAIATATKLERRARFGGNRPR